MKIFSFIASLVLALNFLTIPVYAYDEEFYSSNNILFYNPESSTCVNGSLINAGRDYNGLEILSDAQKKQIATNQSVYETAAKEAGIPWQMLAVLHLRETGLQLVNPANGQGLYQDFSAKDTDKYPPGQVTQESFLEQSKWAAAFIKGKTSLSLLSGDVAAVKDAFFGYNGRAAAYKAQAEALGFSEGYEGSPYVVNKIEARRDPSALPSSDRTWGQIKEDGGQIEYPANNDYGAYVIYAALTNSTGVGCGLAGSTAEKVVSIAREELALWDAGTLKGNGTDYQKYTNGASGNWCAWFVSWVYNKAGYPIVDGNNGAVPLVDSLKSIGQSNEKFTYYDKQGYTPKIGDIVIQKNGVSHTHIVVAIDGTTITTIGGNQGYGGVDGASSFNTSKVTEYTYDYLLNSQTNGFVTIKG
ncbi:CHAP domain-containing protein [Candidatus Saccharibacteria bacterium]|nr:CHAP domain-containing protein [Candidatus Saccharibacteria bacterium]